MNNFYVGATLAALVLITAICATVYSSIESERQYYEAVNQCIASGSSFVPTVSRQGACIRH